MTSASGLTLVIDASTYDGSVALLRDGVPVSERVVAMKGETEERLMPAVHGVLGDAGATVRDIARVVCGEGPGSFTSLRIAAAIAKGIAFGNDVPLFAISSLSLVVATGRDLVAGTYLASLDAMRGERFVAPFHRDGKGFVVATGPLARIPAAEVAAVAATLGAIPIGPLEQLAVSPQASGAAALLDAVMHAGAVSIDTWEPTYGRLAEAQVKWEAAHGRPLGA